MKLLIEKKDDRYGQSLCEIEIGCLAEESDGTIWLGVAGGWVCLNTGASYSKGSGSHLRVAKLPNGSRVILEQE